MPEATFNLGDAVYQQKRYDEAAKQFQLSAQTNPDKSVKAKAYHNLGNTFLEQKKYEDAAKAYKNALKENSKDADTKYNLAYANAMLKQQQQNGGKDPAAGTRPPAARPRSPRPPGAPGGACARSSAPAR